MTHYQCRLQREGLEQVAWIPERAAKAGASIELKPSGEMWKVITVFAHPMPDEVLKETQRQRRSGLPSTRGK